MTTQTIDRTWWAEQTKMIGDTIEWCKAQVDMEGVPITWAWNDRFTARMGDARTNQLARSGHVRFSRPLWPRAVEGKPRNTVIHECAHVLANIKHNRNVGHGHAWKRMMMILGETPRRCFTEQQVNREGMRRRQARFTITCPGCETTSTSSK